MNQIYFCIKRIISVFLLSRAVTLAILANTDRLLTRDKGMPYSVQISLFIKTSNPGFLEDPENSDGIYGCSSEKK